MKIEFYNKQNSVYANTNSKCYRNIAFTNNPIAGNSQNEQKLKLFDEYEANINRAAIQRNREIKDAAIQKFKDSKKESERGNIAIALRFFQDSFNVLESYINPSESLYTDYLEFGGDLYQKNGDLNKAGELYQRSMQNITLNPKTKDSDYSHIFNKLARNYLLQGDNRSANELLDQSMNNIQSPKDTVDSIITRMFGCDIVKDDIAGLINYLNTLEEIYSLEPNLYLQIMTALLYRSEAEYQASNLKVNEIIEGLNKKGDNSSSEYGQAIGIMAANYYDLSKKEGNSGYLDKSLHNYKKALKVADDNQDKEQANSIRLSIGQIYYDKQDYEQSKKYLSEITNNAPSDTAQKCLELLGDISVDNKDYKTAFNYYETQRKILLTSDNIDTIIRNLEKLVASAKKSGNITKMQQYIEELNNLKTTGNKLAIVSSCEDLIYLGTYNADKLKNEKVAQEYYIKAMKTPDINEENRATVQIYLGISQIRNDEVVLGIKNAKEGCKTLEALVCENKFKNDNTPMILFATYSKLGELHYFERSEYKEAAQCLQKALNVAESQNLFSKMSEDNANKLYSRLAASYYKAQDSIKTNADYAYSSSEYSNAEKYFGVYLKKLTNNRFSYSSLNDNFVDFVIDQNKTSASIKIATSLEMLGVVCVKNRRFQTAFKCFETSLKIRRKAQGNKVDSARDLLALGRVAMLGDYKNLAASREYLESAYQILQKELGPNHPETQKECAFIDSYYGVNITSGGKYLYKKWEALKNKAAEVFIGSDNKNTNKWEQEIIDDFHLVYKDLNICE